MFVFACFEQRRPASLQAQPVAARILSWRLLVQQLQRSGEGLWGPVVREQLQVASKRRERGVGDDFGAAGAEQHRVAAADLGEGGDGCQQPALATARWSREVQRAFGSLFQRPYQGGAFGLAPDQVGGEQDQGAVAIQQPKGLGGARGSLARRFGEHAHEERRERFGYLWAALAQRLREGIGVGA
ncbi:hypothetical protein D3C86_993250 [compost metagenome]